ncbi:mobilization protein [Bacteroidia bacterium]|nr:mobilization protein [Bacteroidia bacterium]
MMKEKKGGRPKLSPTEKLKYRIAVNLCTKDYYVLKAKAIQAGMTCAEVARLAISGCQVRQRLTTEQMDCIRKLSSMGNNLNQITRKANAEGYSNARNEYLYLADKIDNALTLLEDGSKDS